MKQRNAIIALAVILALFMGVKTMTSSPTPIKSPGYNAQCWGGNDPAPTTVVNCDPLPLPSAVNPTATIPVPTPQPGPTHRRIRLHRILHPLG